MDAAPKSALLISFIHRSLGLDVGYSPEPANTHASSPRQHGTGPENIRAYALRRIKATLIYRRTGNLRAVQLLLGHTKIKSTVRYLGIEVDDALAIADQVDV